MHSRTNDWAEPGPRLADQRRVAKAAAAIRIACLGMVLCGLVATGCGEEPVEQAPVARPVKILALGDAGVAEVVEYLGKVMAAQQVDLAFEVSGKIIELPVSEAQPVEKGALLARLDPRDFRAKLDAELARSNASKAEFNRVQKLYEADVVSEQELDRARRNFEVTGASVKTARKALEESELRAPFSGVVAKKLVENFQNVNAKQAVLVLQDDSSLELEVDIPERDLTRMRPGLSLAERTALVKPRVTVSSLPDRSFPAKLKEFATTADPATRTFEVTLGFEKPEDVAIFSGMTAKVTLTIPQVIEGSGFAIPARAALADEAGDAFVWLLDPGSMQVSRRKVALGELAGASVRVTSGLDSGDQIAISGVHHLREGMEVRRFEN